MVKMLVSLTEEERTAIHKQADQQGLTTSAYVRGVIRDSFSRSKNARRSEVSVSNVKSWLFKTCPELIVLLKVIGQPHFYQSGTRHTDLFSFFVKLF